MIAMRLKGHGGSSFRRSRHLAQPGGDGVHLRGPCNVILTMRQALARQPARDGRCREAFVGRLGSERSLEQESARIGLARQCANAVVRAAQSPRRSARAPPHCGGATSDEALILNRRHAAALRAVARLNGPRTAVSIRSARSPPLPSDSLSPRAIGPLEKCASQHIGVNWPRRSSPPSSSSGAIFAWRSSYTASPAVGVQPGDLALAGAPVGLFGLATSAQARRWRGSDQGFSRCRAATMRGARALRREIAPLGNHGIRALPSQANFRADPVRGASLPRRPTRPRGTRHHHALAAGQACRMGSGSPLARPRRWTHRRPGCARWRERRNGASHDL